MNHTSERPLFIEQIRVESGSRPPLRLARRPKPALPPLEPSDAHEVFTVCTGNRWMELAEREPEPKMLFGEFWRQGEICILFADTNVGKSVLAVQIANSISRHSQIRPFALKTRSKKVLYVDFELSTQQFYTRYRDEKGNYNFNDKFIRAGFNPGADTPPDGYLYDEYVIAGIEYKIQLVGAGVLIIDNITCLRGGIENSAVALALMTKLKALKTRYNLSILVLAHTPKRRNPCRPLSPDDLQGSKLIINFADSAFAIGRSSEKKGLCYLRQIKQRSTEQVYGDDNVCLCSIKKLRGMLRFRFHGTARERDHLATPADHRRARLPARVIQLSARGHSQRQIKQKLNVSLGLVNKLMRQA